MKKQPMNVVVAGLRGFPNVQGGIETHCEKLYPRLSGKGCEVTVFARSPYMAADATTFGGVNLHSLTCPTNKFMETVAHTFRSVLHARRLSPDVLHIHAIGPSLFAPLARLMGMNVVVTTHGPDYERAKWKGPAKAFLKFCERMGMTGAHEVIAIAENIAADIRSKYSRSSTIIPNGVEISAPLDTEEALRKFGLEKGRYLLAVGRFVPEKGFHDLMNAFDKAGLNGWKLAIAGRADHEDAYSQQLKARAAQNPNVVLTGFLKGTPLHELYSHAGMFVIPSYYEGLPIVLLEALSYGLPCIASNIKANRISGWPLAASRAKNHFFRVGDIDDLTARMREFAESPLTNEERRAQIAMVEREYNWDRIAEQTLEVYRKAAGNQRMKGAATC